MSVKFIIVSAPRTGSTLLCRTLNSLDGVCCHGEILNVTRVLGFEDGFSSQLASPLERKTREARLLRDRDADPVGFIHHAFSVGDDAAGMKILYHAFLLPHWIEVRTALLALPEIRIIHLRRQNRLRRFVSDKIMRAGGPNNSLPGGRSAKPLKVRIEIADFLKKTSFIDQQDRKVSSILAGHDVLNISYEDLSANLAATVSGVCRFLGLNINQAIIKPALRKIGAENLRETILNYDELLENDITKPFLLD